MEEWFKRSQNGGRAASTNSTDEAEDLVSEHSRGRGNKASEPGTSVPGDGTSRGSKGARSKKSRKKNRRKGGGGDARQVDEAKVSKGSASEGFAGTGDEGGDGRDATPGEADDFDMSVDVAMQQVVVQHKSPPRVRGHGRRESSLRDIIKSLREEQVVEEEMQDKFPSLLSDDDDDDQPPHPPVGRAAPQSGQYWSEL